ncbi:MAG TPA: DapH/DapD/GlmU-related protein [Coriobacteriia bacterium]|nr:DapH/DapD/GlmU-related protein [Coriobacteriia bacterium]
MSIEPLTPHVNVPSEEPIIGAGTIVETPCIVGKPGKGGPLQAPATNIGRECVLRPFTTIYRGVTMGDRVQTGQGVTIREDNVIGDDVSIGTNAVLECGNRIGNRVRIHTGCFLEMVTVGDDVFIGPNVVFADDPHPPCPRYEECVGGARVGDRASIGANSTILPGVRIGNGALVGAGTVVVSDVPEGKVVAGNPGRVLKSVDELVCTSGLLDKPYAWREGSQ